MAIRASAAVCDITPDSAMPMPGFPGTKRVSDGTLSHLYASAVHIRGGAGGIIVISLDLHSLDPVISRKIRAQIAKATGTREENIFISATGCASAPYTEHALYMKNDPSYAAADVDYVDHIVEMSVKAASEAAVSSRPASVAIIPLSNHGTGAFIIKGENGRVIAAVVVCDDVADYMGKDNLMISSDFVGHMRSRLMARFGGEPVVAYIPAPCAQNILEDRLEYGDAATKAAGERLANDLVTRLKALTSADFLPNPYVGGKLIDLYSLPRRELPQLANASALLNTAMKMGTTPSNESDDTQKRFRRWALIEANRTMSMVLAFKEGSLEASMQDYDPVYLQSLTVGPLRIIGFPCAVLRNCAAKVVTESGPHVWLAQNINGTMMGSVLTCGRDTASSGRLLSPVFDRDVAGRLISSALAAATEDRS